MCKIFKVLPSDDFVLGITSPELAWIHAMILQDEKEDYEDKLNFVEYLASFSNPEAVRKIRNDRKTAKHLSDNDFATLISSISGREAPKFKPLGNES